MKMHKVICFLIVAVFFCFPVMGVEAFVSSKMESLNINQEEQERLKLPRLCIASQEPIEITEENVRKVKPRYLKSIRLVDEGFTENLWALPFLIDYGFGGEHLTYQQIKENMKTIFLNISPYETSNIASASLVFIHRDPSAYQSDRYDVNYFLGYFISGATKFQNMPQVKSLKEFLDKQENKFFSFQSWGDIYDKDAWKALEKFKEKFMRASNPFRFVYESKGNLLKDYAHTETAIIQCIFNKIKNIIEEVDPENKRYNSEFPLKGIQINIISRYDICDVCSGFIWEAFQKDSYFRKAITESLKNYINEEDFGIAFLVESMSGFSKAEIK